MDEVAAHKDRDDVEHEAAAAAGPRTSRWRALSRIVWVGLVCKVVYLVQYLDLPFLFGPLFDSQVYLLQARRITEGRFGDPTLLAFSPLYGYFLALLGAHQGSILPVVVQLGLGLGNLVLVHRITSVLFGELAGSCSAMLYLGYGPLLFFETKIMSETLSLTLLLVAVDLSLRPSFLRGAALTGLAAGGSMALAVLARASLLPSAALFTATLLLPRTGDANDVRWVRRPPARRAFWFAAALSGVLLSHGAWTKQHSGLFVPVILVSNTAARATQRTWTGDLSVFTGEKERAVSAFSVVRQASERLSRARRGEPEPARDSFSVSGYLAQLPSKLWLTLRDRETSFDYGYYGERSELWLLRLPVVSFGLLLSLAAIGLTAAARASKLRALSSIGAVAVGTLVVTTMFHPSTRYRLPILAALLPLAGYAWQVAWQIERPRLRRWALSGLAGVTLVFSVVQFVRPLENPAWWQLRVAEAAVEEGDFAAAQARIDAARRLAPLDKAVGERATMLSARLPSRPVH